ncbi:4-hydroxymandelate oxidase [Streptomyces zhaozhouensis]|uniref:4-hydroxymandelate oxidase n=1 Tax=Streptomyces zhaozhouensis TaxID=1300267 RepID=A0A286E0K1_9ACTN|nr:alpha-hydroxy acid oxidase [Streptomyces zhaozhouensis]SOD64431.1 4-hydroxymandelate oxidase [Streptomyces zhaozhouensis]
MSEAAAVPPRARLLDCADFTDAARRVLPRDVWDFIAGGAGRERTLAANEAAFGSVRLRPRGLSAVGEPDTAIRVLGDRWGAPLGIAPLAYHELAHADGESGTAEAAGALGLPLVVSTFASQPLERIRAAAGTSTPLWLQLYCFRDQRVTDGLARRAADAGYQALVVTVDTPYMGRRLRDLRNDFRVPAHIRPANLEPDRQAPPGGATDTDSPSAHSRSAFCPDQDWTVVGRLRRLSGLPVLAKGVMTAQDTRAALSAGAAGIVVSNHGGRQLDGAPAALDALGEVVTAAEGRVPVFLDGGVRGGADAFVALALGATAVFVGRPVLYALAADGAPGVRRLLSLLCGELTDTMVFTGHRTVPSIDATAVEMPR